MPATETQLIVVEIETAIRYQSCLTPPTGQKSLQTIKLNFENQTFETFFKTGTTDIGPLKIPSVRDDFQIGSLKFHGQESVSFTATGQTATGIAILPDIDYSLNILVSRVPKVASLDGSHDGYPSYNVAVNGKTVYDHVQGCLHQLAGKKDVNVLRKQVDWA